MKKIIILSGLLLTFLPFTLWAQKAANDTITRNVMVESVYNPVLTSSEKRTFLPEEQPAVEHKEPIVYAFTPQTAAGYQRLPIRLDGIQFKDDAIHRGFVRLGGGNRLNVNAEASYRFSLSDNDVLGIGLGVEGWKGAIPYGGNSWNSNRNDMLLRADYGHEGSTSFKAGAHLGRHAYNYILADSSSMPEFDIQKAIDYGAYATINGVASDLNLDIPLGYTVDVAIDQWQNRYMPGLLNRNTESHLKANVAAHYDTDGKDSLCIGVNNDFLSYAGLEEYSNGYYLNINPSWHKEGRIWSASLGMNIDTKSSLHRLVQVSPDCHFSFIPFKSMQISLTADGGRNLCTFSDLYAFTPWWSADVQPTQSYTRLNARAQADIRLAEGLHLSAWGGCRFIADDLVACRDTVNSLLTAGLRNTDTRVTLMGASMTYTWKDLFRVGAELEKQMWRADDAKLLTWKPDMELNISARARIFDRLHANAGIHCIRYSAVEDVREPFVADVSAGADFRVGDHISVWAKGDNLLNRHHSLTPVYPSQGLRIMLGVTARF